jgi:beta-aspartyl-peptidase (threonine type)
MVLPPTADGVVAPTPSAEEAQAARQAIQAVLDAQVAAWNRRDLEGFMRGYWNSPDLSFFSGKVQTSGWKATLQRYRDRYQAGGKEMGTLAFHTVVIDVLSPQFALVRGRWQLQTSKEKPGGLFTLLFRKQPDGWRIIHDHTSS